jgi:hypothetical protein
LHAPDGGPGPHPCIANVDKRKADQRYFLIIIEVKGISGQHNLMSFNPDVESVFLKDLPQDVRGDFVERTRTRNT